MEELKGKKISVRAIKLDDFYAVQSGEGMNNEKSFNPLLDMEDLG